MGDSDKKNQRKLQEQKHHKKDKHHQQHEQDMHAKMEQLKTAPSVKTPTPNVQAKTQAPGNQPTNPQHDEHSHKNKNKNKKK